MLQCPTNQLPARLVPPAPKGKGTSARLSVYRAAKANFAKRARSGGRGASAAILSRGRWSVGLKPQRNARRTDAVEIAENIANSRNMSERPVSEWMARIGYAVRGKTGLAA
jgi:hypothetical protein